MQGALKRVYRYRQLAGRCETGAGLEFDEISDLIAIEADFGRDGGVPADRRACAREYFRHPVDLPATLLQKRFRDPVRIFDLAPGGFMCEGAPFLQEHDRVEVIIGRGGDGTDTGGAISYRFKAEVAWTRDRDDDCIIGFRFVGVPLVLRHHMAGERQPAAMGSSRLAA